MWSQFTALALLAVLTAAAQDQVPAEALFRAALQGDAATVRSLLKVGIAPDVRDDEGQTALMKASALQGRIGHGEKLSFAPDHEAVARLLLDKGADPNATDRHGGTALMFAMEGTASEFKVLGAYEEMVRLLLSRGARVNMQDDRGWSPLLIALNLYVDQPALLRLLLDRGADVRAHTVDGKTGLMLAARLGKIDRVRVLLAAKGIEVNAQDNQGETALMVTVSERGAEAIPIAKAMLTHGADPNLKNKRGETAADIAAGLGYTDRLDVLIAGGAKINRAAALARVRDRAMLRAVSDGDIGKVKTLLDQGANINATYDDGQTGLMAAAFAEHGAELTRLLLGRGARVDAADRDGSTALMIAADHYNNTTAQLLLDKNADPNIADKDGNTALLRAAASRHSYDEDRKPLIHLLVDAGANVRAKNAKGVTALMLTALEGNPAVRLLLAKGADPKARDENGDTPLLYATTEFVREEERDAGQALIEAGADVNATNNAGETPLMRASRQYEPEGIDILIDKGANVNAHSNNGRTALMYAIDGPSQFDNQNHLVYSPKIAAALIASGADVNARDLSGRTPLLLAVLRGHADIVPLLIGRGADVNVRDNNGDTCLTLAGSDRIAELLREAGAKK